MFRKAKVSIVSAHRPVGYDMVLNEVVNLLEAARRASARTINTIMTATHWELGRRIVEHEQGGSHRAEYGRQLLSRLSVDLTRRFGRGFSIDNLELMRKFYAVYQPLGNSETPSRKLLPQRNSETVSRNSTLQVLSARFPLPWSHYVRLLSVENENARQFYETEALRGGWSVRQLIRQINTRFYERTALSRNKISMLAKGARRKPGDMPTPEEQIKDPFVLEFLDLKDEYSESDLEEAIIRRLEQFLLELGGDFTFVGRQRRLRVDGQWFRVDLLFYHRRLRCLVIIDLKLSPFTPADVGQMNLYLNYAREHWTHEGESPPIGLVLCAGVSSPVARYAMAGLENKVIAGDYRVGLPRGLPSEEKLRREIADAQRQFELRRMVKAVKPAGSQRSTVGSSRKRAARSTVSRRKPLAGR